MRFMKDIHIKKGGNNLAMKFNKIVLVDNTGLRDWAVDKLQKYAFTKIERFNDCPKSETEIINRIGDAQAIFVSWNTEITGKIMQACPNLKYIGMCCSLYDESSANVDIRYARQNGIIVTGIRDYGDEGLIEFIIAELIRLLKGLGTKQWKSEPVELTNRKLGIIGMGTTGQMLVKRAHAFGMQVYYYNRSRKYEIEKTGVKYLSLEKLLNNCEIISTHLPKHTYLLDEQLFSIFGNGKILVNTSLGLTFDKNSFLNWINSKDNFAIFDGDGVGDYLDEFQQHSQIIAYQKVGGWTAEAVDRLSEKVVENFKGFLINLS